MTSERPTFLLVIPAFHESRRLPIFLDNLAAVIDKHFPQGRIVVCDDGSGPEEQTLLREQIEPIRKRHSSLLPPLFLEINQGKGGAILAGWDAHPGYDYFGFIDADGAISPGELCRVAKMLSPDASGAALFGSRIKMLGRKIERSFWRHVSGRIFATLVGIWIESDTHDSQCGLKFVPATALNAIRPWLKGRRFAFDVELLTALKTIGYPIVEVPLDWQDIPGSKVSFFRDVYSMIISLSAIKKEMAQRQAELQQTKNTAHVLHSLKTDDWQNYDTRISSKTDIE